MKKLFVLAFAACSLAARAAVVADGDRYEDGANIVIGTYAASDNALRGLTPEIIAGGRGSELPGAPLSLLGDGAIPMPGESVSEGFEVTLADNTTLEYAWSLDNPLVIDEIRIFSCWGGGQYRNDIVVNSIQYRDSEGNWLSAVRPPAGCEYSFGWSINSAYCNVGTTADAVSRCLRIYCDGVGENLCRYATGLRIAFGYQDHGYGGFSEIEAKIHHETWHDDGGTGWFSDGDDVIKTAGAYEFSSAGRLRFSEKVHLTATDSEDVDADIGYFLPGEEYVVVPPAGEGAWTRVTVTPVEVFPFATVASVSGDVEVRVGETYTSYIFTNTSSSASITFATPGVADLLLVGGGGAGGFLIGGGGGAGAVLMEYGRPVAAGENAVSVGAGGKAVANGNWVQGGSGYDTTFGPLAAIGGGGGAGWHVGIGADGGSGGGATGGRGGDWNLMNGKAVVLPGALGHDGGKCYSDCAGGGGGAGGAGVDGNTVANTSGDGGPGIQCDFSGTMAWYAAGGGGGTGNNAKYAGMGGSGIGGNGGQGSDWLHGANATPGKDGTGSGGGGGDHYVNQNAGDGGSGIAIVRVFTGDASGSVPYGLLTGVGAVRQTSAEVNLAAYSLGAAECDIWVEYGYVPSKAVFGKKVATMQSNGTIGLVLDGLAPGKTYYAKVRMDNGTGSAYADGVLSFTTLGEDLENGTAGIIDFRLDGDAAVILAEFPAEAKGGDYTVLCSGTYAGTDLSEWDVVSGVEVAAGPSGTVEFEFEVPAGAKYFRVMAENGAVSVSGALPIGELEGGDYSATRKITSADVEICGGDVVRGEFGPYTYYKLLDTSAEYVVKLAGVGNLDYLLVGGGGGGNGTVGGGGGGGGFVWRRGEFLLPGDYAVSVGAGGYATGQGSGVSGGATTFNGTTAYGGACGTGYRADDTFQIHLDGASGGGGGDGCPGGLAIYGDQGHNGGASFYMTPGGGGGAGSAGETPVDNSHAGNGGAGRMCNITGSSVYYGGGGGGGAGHISWGYSGDSGDRGGSATPGRGGLGGGGNGCIMNGAGGEKGADGLGGGGGGGGYGWEGGNATDGGAGGSGVAIIRVFNAGSGWTAPLGSIDDVDGIDETSATFDWTVFYCGAGAEGGALTLRYGRSSAALDHSLPIKTLSSIDDFGSVVATGLQPGSRYYARLYVDNGLGGGAVPASDFAEFATVSDATDAAVLDTEAAVIADGELSIGAIFGDEIDGAGLYIGFASEYGSWIWTALAAIDGEESRNVKAELPAGARYVRFKAVKGDDEYLSGSRLVADIDVVVLDAIGVTYVSMASVGSVSATINANVISCGEAESCDLTVEFGNSAGNLHQSRVFSGLSEGVNRLEITGLSPSRTYFFTIRASNALGEESEATAIESFSTLPEIGEGAPSPDRPGCVFNGLWQIRSESGVYETEVSSGPGCAFVTGVHAASHSGSATWAGTGCDGSAQVFDWVGNLHYVYKGYVYLEAAKYYFMGYMLADCELWIDGTRLFESNRIVEYDNSSGVAGWHLFEARMYGNGGGPHNGVVGLGWRTGSPSEWNVPSDWNAFVDPGDGSLLRTALSLRDAAVESRSFASGVLSATVGVAAGEAGELHIVFGADYRGDAPSGWEYDVKVADLSSSAQTVQCGESCPEGSRYARFYIRIGGSYQWCGGAILLPDLSVPAFDGDVAASGFKGDSIDVSGRIASTGAGEEASVTIFVAKTSDMSNAVEWNAGTYRAGESFSFSVHTDDASSPRYIAPGLVYYVKAVLSDGEGGEDSTNAKQIETPAAHSFVQGSYAMTSARSHGYYSGTLNSVGANGTTVYVLSGAAQNTLTNVAAVLITEPGRFTVTVDYPFIGERIYSKMVISNGCATASWVEESDTRAMELVDTLTYRWTGNGADNSWEDPGNWEADADVRSQFPNSQYCNVIFATATPDVEIATFVHGYYYANTIDYDTPGMKVKIEGTTHENSASRLEIPYSNAGNLAGYFADGIELTLKGILYDAPTCSFSQGMTLNLDNAFFNNKNQPGGVFDADNITINLANDSLCQFINDHTFFEGRNLRINIDNSTFYNSCGGAMYNGWNYHGNSVRVDFYGDHPEFEFKNIVYVASPSRPQFVFHVPVGGYASDPLVIAGDPFVGVQDASYGIDISVASDSPALSVASTLDTRLFTTGGTMPTDNIALSGAGRARLEYGENGKSILVGIAPGGLSIFVK